jgi:hypothetical protein
MSMTMTNEEASNILRLVATEALEGVSRFVESENNRDMFKQAYEMAIKSLEESVSVVRCKDCKWSYDAIGGTFCSHGVCVDCVVYDDWFCPMGERRIE